jgi:hypothetical protein
LNIIIIMFRVIAALCLALAALPASAQDLPQGWRLPAAEELAASQRQASPRKFAKTAADLNGDGVIDEAYLLKNEASGREGLWVLLSSGKGDGFGWVKLAESTSAADKLLVMGLDTLPPGNHAYTCFFAARDCNWNAAGKARARLTDPALRYFSFSGDASFFFWSRSRQAFLRAHATRSQ